MNKNIRGNHRVWDDRGSVLLMVILIFATMAIMGTVVLNGAVNENRLVKKEHEYQQAYYIARAGAEAAATYLENNKFTPSELDNYVGFDAVENDVTVFSGGSFQIGIKREASSDNLIIESIGKFEGLQRTVKLKMEKESLFVGDAITLIEDKLKTGDNNIEISGNVVMTKDKDEVELDLGKGETISESEIIYRELDFDLTGIDYTRDEGDWKSSDNKIEVNGSETIEISEEKLKLWNNKSQKIGSRVIYNGHDSDDYYDSDGVSDYDDYILYADFNKSYCGKTTIDNEGRLIFDLVDGNTLKIHMEKLEIKNGGVLSVTGNGLIILYVDDMADIVGKITVEDSAKLLISVQTDHDFAIKTSSDTLAETFIYAPDSKISIENGSLEFMFKGSIICSELELKNNAAIVYDEIGIFPVDVDPLFDYSYYSRGMWTE